MDLPLDPIWSELAVLAAELAARRELPDRQSDADQDDGDGETSE
jgi:hypothetical protein